MSFKIQYDMGKIRCLDKLQILQKGYFDIHIRRLVDKSIIKCNISINMLDQYRS